MRRRIMTFAFCALLVTPLLSQSQMRPGRWETTTQMDMPGMPVKMPATTNTRCVTAAEAATPANTVQMPAGRGRGNSDCKVTDQKTEGNNKLTWKFACTGANAATGDGEMGFNGDSYTSKMTMNMAQGAMTMQITGKRLGDCTQ